MGQIGYKTSNHKKESKHCLNWFKQNKNNKGQQDQNLTKLRIGHQKLGLKKDPKLN